MARKSTKKPAETVAEDAYYFSPAGLGTKADRTQQTSVRAGCLEESEIVTLLEGDGLFASLLGRIVADSLRGGFSIKVRGENDPAVSSATNERVHEWAVETSIEAVWRQHFIQRQAFGGAVLLEVSSTADQGRPRASQPAEQRFMSLAPVEITASEFSVLDPFSPDYQKPVQWHLNGYPIHPSWARVSTTPKIYSTNLGVRTGTQTLYQWAGPSKARRFIDEVRRWGMSLQAATSALQTLSQLVLSSSTFRAVQVRAETGSMAQAQSVYWNRLSDLAERRSSMQPIGIHPDETLAILTSSITGISEVLDRLMVSVAAAAEMPVTVAFGVSPGGFGTGASEQQLWASRVSEFRRLDLTPLIQWTLERAFGDGAKKWQICYEPIDSPTASEDADIRFKQSQIDVAYIDRGVVTANEVALSRFTGEYSTQTQIDVETREDPLDMSEPDDEPDEVPEPAESDEPGDDA